MLLLKLLLVPALIYLVTIAGRKWGPGIAGWLSAFPIVSGPILLVISLEQGPEFGASAAAATLLAVLAILVFSVAYAWASARGGVVFSMCCALAAYALAVICLRLLELPLGVSFLVVVCALGLVSKAFPPAPAAVPEASRQPRSDLPWRMIAGAALVLSVTFTAQQLGPRMSGLLAMFPIMSTVLVGFSHQASGRAFAVALLRGMVFGYFSFATFCLVVSFLLTRESLAFAFVAAVLCALVVQLAVRWFITRRRNVEPQQLPRVEPEATRGR